MRVFNKKIITASVMNANLASEGIPLDSIFGYSIQAVYTGTPTGVLKLQCSADPIQNALQLIIIIIESLLLVGLLAKVLL